MKLDIKKLPMYFMIALFLSVFLFFIVVGLSFWILAVLLLWGLFYLIFVIQRIKFSFLRYEWVWIFFFAIIVITILLSFGLKSGTGTKKSTSSGQKPLTKDECAPIKAKYNNKQLTMTSDGLNGRASIRITDENTCKAEIVYQYIFSTSLEKNNVLGNWYMGYTTEKDSKENQKSWGGNGSIAPIYNGRNTLPDDPYMISSAGLFGDQGDSATSFYTGYSEAPYLSEERYKEITAENKIFIIDGRQFIVETKDASGTTTTADDTKIAREGKIVKTFDVKFSE